MKQEILTQFPWPWLPSLGLLIFFVFFLALLIVVCLDSQKPVFQAAENLPLQDGERHE